MQTDFGQAAGLWQCEKDCRLSGKKCRLSDKKHLPPLFAMMNLQHQCDRDKAVSYTHLDVYKRQIFIS